MANALVALNLVPLITQHPVHFAVNATEEQMAKTWLEPHAFRGEWNYPIRPTKTRSSWPVFLLLDNP